MGDLREVSEKLNKLNGIGYELQVCSNNLKELQTYIIWNNRWLFLLNFLIGIGLYRIW